MPPLHGVEIIYITRAGLQHNPKQQPSVGQGLNPTDPDVLYLIQGFLFKISETKISREERAIWSLESKKGQSLVLIHCSQMVQVDLQAGGQIQQGTRRITEVFNRGKTSHPAYHW